MVVSLKKLILLAVTQLGKAEFSKKILTKVAAEITQWRGYILENTAPHPRGRGDRGIWGVSLEGIYMKGGKRKREKM